MTTVYVDESYRPEECQYVLSGVIVDDDHADPLRRHLTAMLQADQKRLHWRKSRSARPAKPYPVGDVHPTSTCRGSRCSPERHPTAANGGSRRLPSAVAGCLLVRSCVDPVAETRRSRCSSLVVGLRGGEALGGRANSLCRRGCRRSVERQLVWGRARVVATRWLRTSGAHAVMNEVVPASAKSRLGCCGGGDLGHAATRTRPSRRRPSRRR